jgi:hypothetical protein
MIEQVAPPVLAFATSMLAIYADCYLSVRDRLRWVPRQFWRSPGIFSLAVILGLFAVAAFERTVLAGKSSTAAIDKILSFDIPSPYLRAIYVGALVLVIVRSKFFDIKGSPFGLEYFYREMKSRVVMTALQRWSNWRDSFIRTNFNAAFAEATYFDHIVEALETVIRLDGADSNTKTKTDLESAIKSRPVGDPDGSTKEWTFYYRAITRLTLDTCGTEPFKGYRAFQFPG